MDERQRLLKRGRYVETASLLYNAVEVGVSPTAGFLTGSAALISWALDSTVEGVSAATLIWRLHGEEAGISRGDLARRKRVALRGRCRLLDRRGLHSLRGSQQVRLAAGARLLMARHQAFWSWQSWSIPFSPGASTGTGRSWRHRP